MERAFDSIDYFARVHDIPDQALTEVGGRPIEPLSHLVGLGDLLQAHTKRFVYEVAQRDIALPTQPVERGRHVVVEG